MSTYAEFKDGMNAFRARVDSAAISGKCSQSALEELVLFFQRLDKEGRAHAESVIEEWLLSNEEGKRFDALYLAERFALVRLVNAMRALEDRLIKSPEPGAPYELLKVRALASRLATG